MPHTIQSNTCSSKPGNDHNIFFQREKKSFEDPMANNLPLKPCQGNDNGILCKKDARAKCFHCSNDLCLIHFTEHSQLIENVKSYREILSELSERCKHLSISKRIVENPFIQLEKWRQDAHENLDQLAEIKRREIQEKIHQYQIEFHRKRHEQKQKIEILSKRLNDLSQQSQMTNKDIKYLEEKILELKIFFSSIEKHFLKLSTNTFLVQIRTNISPCTSPVPRKSRLETKEHRFEKKRSLSASLL